MPTVVLEEEVKESFEEEEFMLLRCSECNGYQKPFHDWEYGRPLGVIESLEKQYSVVEVLCPKHK
jgi:hypothetical protein